MKEFEKIETLERILLKSNIHDNETIERYNELVLLEPDILLSADKDTQKIKNTFSLEEIYSLQLAHIQASKEFNQLKPEIKNSLSRKSILFAGLNVTAYFSLFTLPFIQADKPFVHIIPNIVYPFTAYIAYKYHITEKESAKIGKENRKKTHLDFEYIDSLFETYSQITPQQEGFIQKHKYIAGTSATALTILPQLTSMIEGFSNTPINKIVRPLLAFGYLFALKSFYFGNLFHYATSLLKKEEQIHLLKANNYKRITKIPTTIKKLLKIDDDKLFQKREDELLKATQKDKLDFFTNSPLLWNYLDKRDHLKFIYQLKEFLDIEEILYSQKELYPYLFSHKTNSEIILKRLKTRYSKQTKSFKQLLLQNKNTSEWKEKYQKLSESYYNYLFYELFSQIGIQNKKKAHQLIQHIASYQLLSNTINQEINNNKENKGKNDISSGLLYLDSKIATLNNTKSYFDPEKLFLLLESNKLEQSQQSNKFSTELLKDKVTYLKKYNSIEALQFEKESLQIMKKLCGNVSHFSLPEIIATHEESKRPSLLLEREKGILFFDLIKEKKDENKKENQLEDSMKLSAQLLALLQTHFYKDMPTRSLAEKLSLRNKEKKYIDNETLNILQLIENKLPIIPYAMDFDFHSRNRILKQINDKHNRIVFFDIENRHYNSRITDDVANMTSYGFQFANHNHWDIAESSIQEHLEFLYHIGKYQEQNPLGREISPILIQYQHPKINEYDQIKESDYLTNLTFSFISRGLSLLYSLDNTDLKYMQSELIENALIFMERKNKERGSLQDKESYILKNKLERIIRKVE